MSKNRKYTVWAAALLSLFALPAAAQEPVSLRECLERGLEDNYGIRIVRNMERTAANNVTLGNAGFLPSVDLSGGWSGTGGDRKQFYRDDTPALSDKPGTQTLNASVNASWTLFEGFSVVASYERLKELRNMGELNTRLKVEEFISQFTAEYYNYIRQTMRLRNLRHAVKLSEERVRIVDVGAEIGSQSRFDLQQAKVDLNSDRSKLVKQHEVLETIRTGLNEMMALQDIGARIVPADTAITFDAGLERELLLERALADNVYLRIARKEGDVSNIDLRAARSRSYPYIRANAGYGYTGNWYDTGSFESQRNLGVNYGVTVGVSLFNGLEQRRQIRNAKIEIENRELEYGQMELGIRADMAVAWMAYRNNIALVKLEEDNLGTARDNFDIAMYRYKMQQLSGLELREAQNSLLEAEERFVQVLYDTKLCEISLRQISGEITAYLE